jgi:hypothetical protein
MGTDRIWNFKVPFIQTFATCCGWSPKAGHNRSDSKGFGNSLGRDIALLCPDVAARRPYLLGGSFRLAYSRVERAYPRAISDWDLKLVVSMNFEVWILKFHWMLGIGIWMFTPVFRQP